MKNFGITGVAGYIAPRHLKAIKETGNDLIAAVDPHDSVGIMDQFFPHAAFFTEIERFDRHLDKLRRDGKGIDYLSICSPNHLHDAHIRLALRNNAHAICEKPLVLNPWNLDLLEKIEEEYQKKIYTILQLRVHPAIVALKEKLKIQNLSAVSLADSKFRIKHDVTLTYITPRGPWYNYSWKGDPSKSGGIATNIGIHLFDLLIWLFGKPVAHEVHLSEFNKMAGFLELENANVKWFLSIDSNDLQKLENERVKGETSKVKSAKITADKRETGDVKGERACPDIVSGSNVKETLITDNGLPTTNTQSPTTKHQVLRTYRSIQIDGDEIEFTEGFSDLHTVVYGEILEGKGISIEESRSSIELVNKLRNEKITHKID